MATIGKHGKRWRVRYYVNGKLKVHSCKTKKKADIAKLEIELALARGEVPYEASRITHEEALRYWKLGVWLPRGLLPRVTEKDDILNCSFKKLLLTF